MEYLSQECYNKLVAELNELINVELPKVKNEIAEARDKGDLSENFEYHAAKRAQGKLLGRIRFKQRVLQYARVMDTSKLESDTVGLFRKVEMTNQTTGAKMVYTIVNPHEADLRAGKLSIKSPIAESLLGKRTGEVVEVHVPAGVLKLKIESITMGIEEACCRHEHSLQDCQKKGPGKRGAHSAHGCRHLLCVGGRFV